jgi:hypothetical protein
MGISGHKSLADALIPLDGSFENIGANAAQTACEENYCNSVFAVDSYGVWYVIEYEEV